MTTQAKCRNRKWIHLWYITYLSSGIHFGAKTPVGSKWAGHEPRPKHPAPIIQQLLGQPKNDSEALLAGRSVAVWKGVHAPCLGLKKGSAWNNLPCVRSGPEKWLARSREEFFSLLSEPVGPSDPSPDKSGLSWHNDSCIQWSPEMDAYHYDPLVGAWTQLRSPLPCLVLIRGFGYKYLWDDEIRSGEGYIAAIC